MKKQKQSLTILKNAVRVWLRWGCVATARKTYREYKSCGGKRTFSQLKKESIEGGE